MRTLKNLGNLACAFGAGLIVCGLMLAIGCHRLPAELCGWATFLASAR